VHRLDAAHLFRLAVEKAPAGSTLHAVADEGVPIRDIAGVIGRHLGQPVAAISPEDAAEHFSWLAGQSLTDQVPVDTILRDGLPPTLSLMAGAMVLWLTAGILAGTVSALRPGSWAGRIATTGVLTALSVPTFLLALLLLAVFSRLAAAGNLWLQPGYVGISQSPGQWLGRMILPWIAVAAGQAGVTARLVRAGILDVLGEDYIRTARAKGLAGRRVFWLHMLRAAILPVVSSIGVGFGAVLGAAAIVDQVFALGGIGQAFLVAARAGDLMVVMGTALAVVILIAVVNLATDVCYALLNPRVRLS